MPRNGRGLFTACSFAFVSKVRSLFQCKTLIFCNHQLKVLVFSETMFANTFIIWDNPKGRKGDGACNCSLRAGGGMLFAAQVVRKETQKCCGWDLLTDGTGSDSRAWDQLQPAMALLLFPWVTSSITQDAPWDVTFRSWLAPCDVSSTLNALNFLKC